MFLVVAALVMMTLAAIAVRGRIPDVGDAAPLGFVSRHWLAEYRASPPR